MVLAPAYHLTTALLQDPEIREAQIVGFVDRDLVLNGKSIEGITIYGYEAIPDLDPDVILAAPPRQHRDDILQSICRYAEEGKRIVVFNQN